MTFVYILIFAATVAFSIILAGGTIYGFIDYPSVVMVVASILLFVLASGQWKEFSCGIKHLFEWQRPEQIDSKTAVRISRLFRTLSFASLAIGGFWSIMGIILMLCNLNPETIGQGLAIVLLTLFYSFFLSVAVFFPISLYYAGKHGVG